MAIEILENTLLKLLVRRGTDADRQKITLESGELGFTTDTVRLFVGDGTTEGGVIVGNKYKGRHANVTSLAPVVTGDYAYDTDQRSLKVCIAGTGAVETDWLTVANQISAGDDTITIDERNKISVGTLSAGNFTADALGSSIELDSDDRIALSGTISVDSIIRRTSPTESFLSLPQKLKIGAHDYKFPGVGPQPESYLGADATGNLAWGFPNIVEATVSPTTASLIPVATIVPFASGANEVPYGWLTCDGSEYISSSYPDLSWAIGTAYNTGAETSTDYFRVPNLNNKVMYGHPDPGDDGKTGSAATSTLMGVTTASPPYSTQTILSATGMHYMIKSIGGVTNPTMTVGKNLSAFMNGNRLTKDLSEGGCAVEFSPLSGNVIIERAPPGMEKFDDGTADKTFTMPAGIHYVKVTVTGCGARGKDSPGGAAATVIANLSAAPGTVFNVKSGAGPAPDDQATTGDVSGVYLSVAPHTALVEAEGGRYDDGYQRRHPPGGDPNIQCDIPGGILLTSSDYVLNGYIVPGASGYLDTSRNQKEESTGVAGYWGNAPAPGGGESADGKQVYTGNIMRGIGGNALPGNGLVLFEWS